MTDSVRNPGSHLAASPADLLDVADLTDVEAEYVEAARAANTKKGYRSDWHDFTSWCSDQDRRPLPASPAAISQYLTDLAGRGAAVGTMARRRSAIRFAHRLRGHPNPLEHARVIAVWEGITRTHGRPPDQSEPLMPPELWYVIDACPTVKHWRTRGRDPEPNLRGHRDRAVLLAGFVGAFRRSEEAAIELEWISDHPQGLVIAIPRSKTNQTGEEAELVVLPRAVDPRYCPVRALDTWIDLAAIESGPLFRSVTKANKVRPNALHPASINLIVQESVARAGMDPTSFSAQSLRAGFVTYAHLRGASDRAIAHQTRHRSLATVGRYTRIADAWVDNAATQLGI